jgi:hypothetical protein
MPSGTSAVSARPIRAGAARQGILLCLLVSLAYLLYLTANAWGLPFGRMVHVYVDGREQTFRSYRRTVGDALQSAQVALRPGDRIVPPLPRGLTRYPPNVLSFNLGSDPPRHRFGLPRPPSRTRCA